MSKSLVEIKKSRRERSQKHLYPCEVEINYLTESQMTPEQLRKSRELGDFLFALAEKHKTVKVEKTENFI